MKKLLTILTISTLTASTPAPLLANTSLTRTKRDVSISNLKNDYIKAKLINNFKNWIFKIFESDKVVYFGTDKGAYKLVAGSDTPTKIDEIMNITINDITSDINNNIYFATSNGAYVLKQGSDTPTKINQINSERIYAISLDKVNNIYFGTDKGAYKLVAGSDTPTKIDGISGYVKSILITQDNNIYIGAGSGGYKLIAKILSKIINESVNKIFFNKVVYIGTNKGAYKLVAGSDTPTKIDGMMNITINDIRSDINNNTYFGTDAGAYVLKQGSDTPTKIDDIGNYVSSTLIDEDNNIYFGTDKGAYIMQTTFSWLKTNVNFNLVDKSKNMVWLRNDQLVVNGQVKVKILNTDIETVKVDDTVMPSPDKKWDFNLPENSTVSENRDYNIEIAFKLDGKSYTGQIIVSSLLTQPSITVQKNTSSFENINSYLYQVPTNDKVGEVTLTSDLYYSDTEAKVSLNKPTGSTVQSGVVYGLNENWQKTGEQLSITGDLSLNATMLNAFQGRFLVETKDSANNSSVYYIVLNKDNLTPNFWNTDQGEQFYQWTNFNGYNENIKKLNSTELNIIIKASENWQKIATDSQFATAVAEWFKNNAKLLSKDPLTAEQVIEQLKKQIPSSIKIPAINTNNYDPTKVSFELDKSEFKPNDKVNITVKYNNEKSTQFTLQIKDSKAPDNSGGDSKLWIIGVVIGVLAGLGIAFLLFKRFVFDKYIYPKIKVRGHKKFVERVRKKEQAAEQEQQEKVASEQAQENRERDDEDNNNNKGGNE